jgi:S1-C subfamily serine protease
VTLADGHPLGPDHQAALLIGGVTSGSPAAAGGVLLGDVLFEFDGCAVESPDDLLDLLGGGRVGKTVTLRVLRAGAVTDLRVTVGERPGR